jgi:phosphoglycolate phosphatase
LRESTLKSGNERFAGVRVLIFDLDGTLVDSALDLALSINAMLKSMGRDPLEHMRIFGYIGNGAPMLVRKSLSEGASEMDVSDGLAYFLGYYRAHVLDNTVAYPGVREGLAMMDGWAMAVLTNKPVRFSEAILQGLGLAKYFRYVYGGDSFEKKKPDPMGVEILLRDLGATPEEAMMVGDSDVDVRTARNAGIWSCRVTYGLGTAGLKEHPPDITVDSLVELAARLDGRE